MGVSLVGCASHRLNRAVQVEMADFETDLDAVQELMIGLRTLTQSSKLRAQTKLRPAIRQDTRYGSTFAVVNRYFTFLEFNDTIEDIIADPLLTPACNRRLRALLKDPKKEWSVSKALQGEGVSLLDARVWLDGLISIKSHYACFIALILRQRASGFWAEIRAVSPAQRKPRFHCLQEFDCMQRPERMTPIKKFLSSNSSRNDVVLPRRM